MFLISRHQAYLLHLNMILLMSLQLTLKAEDKKMKLKKLDLAVLNLLKEHLIALLQESHSIIKQTITSLYMPVTAKEHDQVDSMLIYLTSHKMS